MENNENGTNWNKNEDDKLRKNSEKDKCEKKNVKKTETDFDIKIPNQESKVFEANKLFTDTIIVNRMVTKYIHIGFEAPISQRFSPVFVKGKKGVIFLIPGFLGAVEYYKDFIIQLYAVAKIPIIAVSHGNHTKPTDEVVSNHSQSLLSWVSVHETNWIHTHNVWGQVHHKLVFINHFIPKAVPLIIMGHSIGAEIALRMLKKNSYLPIVRFILILPILEHLDCCPIALKYMAMLWMCRYIVPVAAHTVGLIPQVLQKRIVSLIVNQGIGAPECCQEAATNFSNSVCANAVTELFVSSVKTVKEIDYEILDKYQKYFSFFFSESDAWVPKQYFERLSTVLSLSNTQMPWNSVSHNFFLDDNDVKQVIEVIASELRDNFMNAKIQMIPAMNKVDYDNCKTSNESFGY